MESELVEVRSVVRPEMSDRVVRCLKESGIPRLTVTRVRKPASVSTKRGASPRR